MKPFMRISLLILAVGLALPGYGHQKRKEAKVSNDSTLAAKIRRFAPTDVTADLSHLSAGDRKALDKIIQAAELMDPIYYRQAWSGNVALKKRLEADTTPAGRQRLHYFVINKGPWSHLDNDESFIEGVPHKKPPQGGFYPDDISKEEFDVWAKTLGEEDRKRATGFFYVIRRGADRKLKPVPYSQEYREFLAPAAKLLREAAALTSNQTLKKFLTARADSFLSDNYYASDVAWMDLDSPIDVTIGPYETYEDELFGYKAAFEAFVTLRDETESEKLVKFSSYLQELENNLPVEGRYRNPKLGPASPIRVVDVVYTSGEANQGVQTAAFNLPNDEQVVKEKGSKRVMLKNVQEAKFDKVLVPISKVLIDPSQRSQISFDVFFTHILMHELLHGLGPHNITVDGKQTTVRMQLKELHSAIEEAKADITGLWALQYLIDKGAIDRRMEQDLYTTFLTTSFRSVRFGLTEAHGKGQALQFNYLMDEGGIKFNKAAGTFAIDTSRIKEAVRKLTREILTLQAEGSYEKAKALLDKYAVIRPEMSNALGRLGDVPVDIEPRYTLSERVPDTK
jgi:hypothetical protein